MSEQKFEELIYAYSVGCLDNEELIELLSFLKSDNKSNDKNLGDLQNVLSLLPLVLDIEKPDPQVRDKFARRLFRLRDEARVKSNNTDESFQSLNENIPTGIIENQPEEDKIEKEDIIEDDKDQKYNKPGGLKVVDAIIEKDKNGNKDAILTPSDKKVIKPVTENKSEKSSDKKDNKISDKSVTEKPAEKKSNDKQNDSKADSVKYRNKRSISYQEEKKGFPKVVIVLAVIVITAGLIYFLTGGQNNESKQIAESNESVENIVPEVQQKSIDSLDQTIAALENQKQQQQKMKTADNSSNDELENLMQELKAVKEELAKQQKKNQENTEKTNPKTVEESSQTEQQQAASAGAVREVITQPAQAVNAGSITAKKEESKPVEEKKIVADPVYYSVVDELPIPVGGASVLQKKATLTPEAITAGVEGKVFVQAYIDETGNVIKTSVIKGIGHGCDEVAEFAVKSSKFKPGKVKGQNVKSQIVVPIQFKL